MEKSFNPGPRGVFVDRPNRFVIRVDVDGALIEAHCANPGRLAELLFPGTTVVLERAPGPRKLAFTAVAVERPGPDGITTIPLVSARANATVRNLLLPRLFPGGAVRPEFTVGSSRFDFLVEAGGLRHLVEVKACSEVEFGTALFPDAPSVRARKHLEELVLAADQGHIPHVVAAVVHGRPTHWSPNLHTDPDFARTLLALAPRLNLHAAVFETDASGLTRLALEELPIRLADPGPDSGHLVCVRRDEEGWSVEVEWYPDGFERACSRAPARTTFPLRGTLDRRAELTRRLGPRWRPSDPRLDPQFLAPIMEVRH